MSAIVSKVCILVAAILLLTACFFAGRGFNSPFPRSSEIKPFEDSSMSDAGALSLGIRRLAADLWFVRLMQYYGKHEGEDENPYLEAFDSFYFNKHEHLHGNYGGGKYPEIYSRVIHILSLDPYFTYAALYGAGALAFNLERGDEAVRLIDQAKVYRPKEWKYNAYLAAIGYQKAKDPGKVAVMLAPVLRDPDCPTMIKQMAAFLNKKIGRYSEAAKIYRDIIATSNDKFYLENSQRELKKILPLIKSS